MKKSLFVFMAILAILLFAGIATAEKISWVNPTTYSDGSAISTADKSSIWTIIKIKESTETEWTTFATVKYGGSSYTGNFPYGPGKSVSIQLEWFLHDLYSAPLAGSYVIPTIPPSPGSDITIVR